ncbi:hypothetical protein SAMN04489724_3184 [Algoriphagus locisalis]|uniref:Uncharacterized protein n=1 Tax=Algoriphagus locisalis TaxID=305507 RepID=A0A1I7CGY9_9BACT|nr:hypothetical protein [Algoriphagus locisalis]SFT98693.1 hypothetical protein SAMN04489724_3184 [Algoriphagus locisalis]
MKNNRNCGYNTLSVSRNPMSKTFLLIAIITLTAACKSTQILEGTYHNNCPIIGFFGTTIKFKPDSTFEYSYAGDLMSDRAIGTYSVNGRTIELSFIEEPQEEMIGSYTLTDSLGNVDTVYYDMNINYAESSRPTYFKISGNKLYRMNEEGKTFKREQCYSRTKRFLFWGDSYLTRRKYYLKKAEADR